MHIRSRSAAAAARRTCCTCAPANALHACAPLCLVAQVTGEAWDTQPTLKLRVLKLMVSVLLE